MTVFSAAELGDSSSSKEEGSVGVKLGKWK